jgi:hypothetical protein
VLADLRHHPFEQLVDDPLRRPRDRRVLADEGGRHHQVVAHELVGELVAPGATVLGDDGVLGGDPVGLGVDEGAVHVPEDRCGEAHGSQA